MDPHTEHSEDFRSKFENFEHPPAEQVWRRIQIEMEGDTRPGALAGKLGEFSHVPRAEVWNRIAAEVQPMRQRAVIFWWAATAASIALLLFVGWRFSGKKTGETEQPAATWSAVVPGDSAERPDDSFSGSGQGSDGSQGRNAFAGDNRVPRNLSLEEQGLSPLLFASVEELGAEDNPAEIESGRWNIPPEFLLAVDTLQDVKQSPKYRLAKKNPSEPGNWEDLPPLPDRNQKLYSAALASSLSPAGSASIFNAEYDNASGGADPSLGLGALNEGYGPVARENFNTPLVVGLQMRRSFGKRISLGAGPVYTLMTSSWQTVDAGVETNDRIRRQYLGAAVSANYEFLQGRRLATYFTAGTQFDVGLGRRKRTIVVEDSRPISDNVTNYSLGPQALANVGMGLDYRLSNQFGLYAQGSVQHVFFRTDPNLWTTRRLWPGLQVGLRLQL